MSNNESFFFWPAHIVSSEGEWRCVCRTTALVLLLTWLSCVAGKASEPDSIRWLLHSEAAGDAGEGMEVWGEKEASKGVFSVEATANVSYLIPKGPYNKEILHSYGTSCFDARLLWKPMPAAGNPYDRAMGYPMLQAGISVADFTHVHLSRPSTPYDSRIGRLITLYGGMQYDFFRRGNLAVGVDLQNGVSYCTDPFDERDNIDNEQIGARLSIFFGAGVVVRYRLNPQWSVSLGADFKHYSNGTLDRPNLGINTIGPTVGLQYDLQAVCQEASATGARQPFEGRKAYLEVAGGSGFKTLLDHFKAFHSNKTPLYASPFVSIAPMVRYHLLHASGLEVGYAYAHYAYRIGQFDREGGHEGYRYSPHVVGIGARHEVFFRHFSVPVSAGIYLYRRMGYIADIDESRFYQTIGLRYNLPATHDRLFVGYNVKAHNFSKADCMQVHLGWRFGK
ncbi:MAG: acyloxyacyl hydrolase [Prevotella sp.]|nr:acyloxyacyl hydrolase [Prevotella sp.]